MIFYIELVNGSDRRDNEAVKVNAPDMIKAKKVAMRRAKARGNMSLGRAVQGRGEDRQLVRHLRRISDTTEKRESWMEKIV